MVYERKQGLTLSAAAHFFLLLIIIFGLPSFLTPPPPPEPMAFSVELLPITEKTNVKNSDTPPQEQKTSEPKEAPAEPKPPKPPEPPKPKPPTPPVKTADATPPPPPKPDAVKPPEPKPPEPKPPEPKPKPPKAKAKEEDLAAVLKAVKETAQKEHEKPDKPAKPAHDSGSPSKSISNSYDASQPMSMSEKDAIRNQISRWWNVPAGAKNAQDLLVTLRIELDHDGTVLKVGIADDDKTRYAQDSFFRAAAESAVRAVWQCKQITGLPPDKYGTWHDMELTFDPKQMLF